MQDNTTEVDTKTHVAHPAMILVIFFITNTGFRILYSQALKHTFLFIWVSLAYY